MCRVIAKLEKKKKQTKQKTKQNTNQKKKKKKNREAKMIVVQRSEKQSLYNAKRDIVCSTKMHAQTSLFNYTSKSLTLTDAKKARLPCTLIQ